MSNPPARRHFGAACLAASAALGLSFVAAQPSRAQTPYAAPHDLLYVESNLTEAGQNSVFAFHRNWDGSLTPLAGSPFATGGTGWFDPTYAVGPFDADHIMAADPVGHVLYVPNGGSRSVAALGIAASGSLSPLPGSPYAVRGNTPDALALRGRTLVVVDNGADPKQAGQAFAGYETARLDDNGVPHLNVLFAVPRPNTVLPTQALPLDGSPFLFANEFFGGTISSYFLDWRGALHLIERQAPPQDDGETAQPVPLGLWNSPVAPFLYAGLPNVGRIAVYRLHDTGELGYRRSVAVSGAAPCWIRASKDGSRLYVVNTGDNSVSVLDAERPGHPFEIQHLALRDAVGGSYQIELSPDGRFAYTMEEENSPKVAGKSNQIHVLSVDKRDGRLTEIAASPVKLPVPAGNRPQGLVVF